MAKNMSIKLSIFVEHGREREAADFYAAAFGAQEVDTYSVDGVLAGVIMQFSELQVTIVGSNPNREKMASYGGPFFPKEAGAVSAIVQIGVADIDVAFPCAISAGAVVRDQIQTDTLQRRVASVFDPFGHIWALVEQEPITAAFAV